MHRIVSTTMLAGVLSVGMLAVGCARDAANSNTEASQPAAAPESPEEGDAEEPEEKEIGLDNFKMKDNFAEVYQETLEPYIFAPWAKHMVGSTPIKPDAAVLDLGCGTGAVAREVASLEDHKGRVVCSDIGKAALDVARKSTPEAMKLEFVVADAQDLPFKDGEFDVVLSQQMLQFVEDKSKAVSELKRVLKKGGHFQVSVWTTPGDKELYITHVADVIERLVSPDSRKVIEGPYSGKVDDLKPLFVDAGLKDVKAEVVRQTLPLEDVRGFVHGHIYGFAMFSPDESMRDEAVVNKITDAIMTSAGLPASGNGEILTESIVITGKR